MSSKDPNAFGPYAGYLHTNLWPSINTYTGVMEMTQVNRDEMAPQHAASALAKLVRWARTAPEGDLVHYPDEDSREVEVRSSPLGKALAARAVNLEEEMFFALYGEFGATAEANQREVMAELAVGLGDHGLDWSLSQRITLASHLVETLDARFKIHERVL